MKIVAHLMNDFLIKGYQLFVDNWCISIELFLLANNTDYIGTLCKDCKGFQNDVVTKTLKAGERIMNYE